MRRALLISLLISLTGAGIFALGLLAGVAAGGVPYHDGPNAGHVSEPGFGRWLEEISPFIMLSGAAAAAIGLTISTIVIVLMMRAKRRAAIHDAASHRRW